ncbi:hypothetical protein ACH0CA_01380 [Kytococcus sedentarius]|uniref:hypothetical protein n=1 Tax=Kytococcus sedentarius TaxID=1276 RepID=UPI00387A162C
MSRARRSPNPDPAVDRAVRAMRTAADQLEQLGRRADADRARIEANRLDRATRTPEPFVPVRGWE